MNELQDIERAIVAEAHGGVVVVRDEVSSTMDEARDLFSDSSESSVKGVVFANAQTKGRGRQGRAWVSQKGGGNYLSVAYEFRSLDPSLLGLLPLFVGVNIIEEFQEYPLLLKWPNDLLTERDDKFLKVGGILLESTQCKDSVQVVLGIGINTSQTGVPGAMSFSELSGERVARDAIAAKTVRAVISACKRLPELNRYSFVERYNRSLIFYGQEISFSDHQGAVVTGINRGINGDGSLRLQVGDQQRNLYSGEVHQIRDC